MHIKHGKKHILNQSKLTSTVQLYFLAVVIYDAQLPTKSGQHLLSSYLFNKLEYYGQ